MIKYTSKGVIDKYKSPLVAKKYNQVQGVDYIEIFSPIIKHNSIWVFFAIDIVLKMHMCQFDIGKTYLSNDLITRIYMHELEGFLNKKTLSYLCLLNSLASCGSTSLVFFTSFTISSLVMQIHVSTTNKLSLILLTSLSAFSSMMELCAPQRIGP